MIEANNIRASQGTCYRAVGLNKKKNVVRKLETEKKELKISYKVLIISLNLIRPGLYIRI